MSGRGLPSWACRRGSFPDGAQNPLSGWHETTREFKDMQTTGFGGWKNRNHWWWEPLVAIPMLLLTVSLIVLFFSPLTSWKAIRGERTDCNQLVRLTGAFLDECVFHRNRWIVLLVVMAAAASPFWIPRFI
jgi:hypothetical protein